MFPFNILKSLKNLKIEKQNNSIELIIILEPGGGESEAAAGRDRLLRHERMTESDALAVSDEGGLKRRGK